MCFSRTCFLNSAHLLWIILPMCIFLQQTHFFFPLQFSRQSKMSVVWRTFFWSVTVMQSLPNFFYLFAWFLLPDILPLGLSSNAFISMSPFYAHIWMTLKPLMSHFTGLQDWILLRYQNQRTCTLKCFTSPSYSCFYFFYFFLCIFYVNIV